MKTLLCVANPLKEVLSAGECLQALKAGVEKSDLARGDVQSFLMSDGGDGFLDAVGQRHEFEVVETQTTGPLGDVVMVPFLWDDETRTAFIESAQCCGLHLVEPVRRNLLMSGTAGLADVVAAARENGAENIYVGLGGSATCDGGVGFLWRLACLTGQFRPETCEPRVAMDLTESASPDMDAIKAWLGDVRLRACVDVDNVLLGEKGAARVFAPQKGADSEQVEQLDAWMELWCERVERNIGGVIHDKPGTGAAGGLGFALAAIGADLLPGAKTVAGLIGLTDAVGPQVILLTTEGQFDHTSFCGKAPWAAAKLATDAGGDAAIFCGIADEDSTRQAHSEGVQVIQFGREIEPEARGAQSFGLLAGAVSQYLENQREPA